MAPTALKEWTMTKSAAPMAIASTHPPKSSAKTRTARTTKRTKSAVAPKAATTLIASAAPNKSEAKAPTKQNQIAALLVRDEGATLDQMISATGWLPHTTRAALTGLKKKGYAISSDKVDGLRTYRAVAPQ